MRVGVISDIHANRIALEAVLEDMPPVEALVCAGDVVGYNPWPAECVRVVRERAIPTVQGNHDRMTATPDGTFRLNRTAAAGVEYARERLAEDALAWLGDLPAERRLFDGRVRMVHGHPDDPDRYTFPESFDPRLLGGAKALVLGHTHVQAHERFDAGVVLNPGSVGQPRDGDPRAAYALLDLDTLSVDERRVAYDVEAVQAAIRAAGLPAKTAERLAQGR